eukprot:1401775-Pleurochrysis_carterae.AAC.3
MRAVGLVEAAAPRQVCELGSRCALIAVVEICVWRVEVQAARCAQSVYFGCSALGVERFVFKCALSVSHCSSPRAKMVRHA